MKTALVSDRWFGYLSNISLAPESKPEALEERAFDVEAAARTGKWERSVCFPAWLYNKRREYFKMPPSFVSLANTRG